MSRIILGSLENVSIPALGVEDIIAKVDTGAFSGALHCTNIRIERSGPDQVLHFTPLGDVSLATKTSDFKEITVKSANGHEDVRYILPITITVQGESYHSVMGLSDRTTMKREMLLGRRFLLENDMLVDVMLSKDIDDEAERIDE